MLSDAHDRYLRGAEVRHKIFIRIDTVVRQGVVLFFALMLAVLLAAGCRSLLHPNDLNSVVVTLKRTACYGTCPVYSVASMGMGLSSTWENWAWTYLGLKQLGFHPRE